MTRSQWLFLGPKPDSTMLGTLDVIGKLLVVKESVVLNQSNQVNLPPPVVDHLVDKPRASSATPVNMALSTDRLKTRHPSVAGFNLANAVRACVQCSCDTAKNICQKRG